MHLHVFNDPHGFTLNLTVNRFVEAGAMDSNRFINLNQRTIFRNDKVEYLPQNKYAFRIAIKKMPVIESVSFYPFDFTASHFLRELKKKYPAATVSWVFWSYEFYHRPDRNALNFDNFSADFVNRHRHHLIKAIKRAIVPLVKKVLGIPVFDQQLLEHGYRQIDKFYSFLPEDFRQVVGQYLFMKASYNQFSFLSIEELTSEGLTSRGMTNRIMIGHAATPTLNHVEIFDQLSTLQLSNDFLIPLEYGDGDYREQVKRLAKVRLGTRLEFLEERLELPVYHQRISDAGFAIFNFRWQEALGNILFLLWNGTKVFLKQESSVYRQFREWGLIVFSVESDMNTANLSVLLTAEQRMANKKILEGLFAEQKVKEYWQPLIG